MEAILGAALPVLFSKATDAIFSPSEPAPVSTANLTGEKKAAVQTVDTGNKQKEAELLAQKQKRQKQGFLESFGATAEDNAKYSLL